MSARLALFGGSMTIDQALQAYDPIEDIDQVRVANVVQSRRLSGFMGAAGEAFLGGPQVRALEAQLCEGSQANFAVTTNSWTSGLLVGLLALGVRLGDEVITTPWTMCATSAAIRQAGAVPRYVDISPSDFNLNIDQISSVATQRTSAILAVDIFGKPVDRPKLREAAGRLGVPVLVDSAQAPLMSPGYPIDNSEVDIWGYSFNYHKHIHCGEGGAALTASSELADRMQRARNHGEILGGTDEFAKVAGYNFRLGELESALLVGQLERLDSLVRSRQVAAKCLSDGLADLTGLACPQVTVGEAHAYYILGMTLHPDLSSRRHLIIEALRAEGVPDLLGGYQNIHQLPAYADGTRLPVAESLHKETFLGIYMCGKQWDESDCQLTIEAFDKVWRGLGIK